MALAAGVAPAPVVNIQLPESVNPAQPDNEHLLLTLDRLNERLSEPFVTVNTVTGDYGMQKAQDEYDRLIKNKSPKSKR